jgi:DNA-binding NarL/FixJ family response regulator
MTAALAHFEAAIATLEAAPPGPELAIAYYEIANYYRNCLRSGEALAWGEKALRLAEALGDTRVELNALVTIGLARRDLGEWHKAVDHLERCLALAQEAGLAHGTLGVYMHLGETLVVLGELSRVVIVYEEGMALARRLGWEVRMGGDCLAAGMALLELGRWDEAHAVLDRGLRAAELGHPFARVHAAAWKAVLLLRQGRLSEAEQLLGEVLPHWEARGDREYDYPSVDLALAMVRSARADHAEALRVMEQVIARWRGLRSPVWGSGLLRYGVEIYCGAEQQEQAQELLPELAALAGRLPTPLAHAALADAQGLVAASQGGHAEAAAHFQQAAALWHAVEAPYLEAHARRLGAESLLQSGSAGHLDEARAELATAQAICAALGAPPELEAIAALTTEFGLVPEPGRPAPSQSSVLTRREREVIALIARGYSNRAIAEALVISERTAENHVANILGKLGCTSRAQAAAYAVEHGLAALASA